MNLQSFCLYRVKVNMKTNSNDVLFDDFNASTKSGTKEIVRILYRRVKSFFAPTFFFFFLIKNQNVKRN